MTRQDKHSMQGNPVHLVGEALKVGDKAPDFTAMKTDMTPFKFSETEGVRIISVVPSLDTSVCQKQTLTFKDKAEEEKDITFYTISLDLPFAQGRFMEEYEAKDENIISDYQNREFGEKYGFLIDELKVLNRGIIVVDKDGVIQHIEYVEENTDLPDIEKAIGVAKGL